MPNYEALKGRVEALLEHYERVMVAHDPSFRVRAGDIASQLKAVLTPAEVADERPPE